MRRIFWGVVAVSLCAVIAVLLLPVAVSTQTQVSPSVQLLSTYWLGF